MFSFIKNIFNSFSVPEPEDQENESPKQHKILKRQQEDSGSEYSPEKEKEEVPNEKNQEEEAKESELSANDQKNLGKRKIKSNRKAKEKKQKQELVFYDSYFYSRKSLEDIMEPLSKDVKQFVEGIELFEGVDEEALEGLIAKFEVKGPANRVEEFMQLCEKLAREQNLSLKLGMELQQKLRKLLYRP